MSGLENLCRDGWVVSSVDMPTFDEDTALRCLTLCEKNDCGNYGTNWACPPGWKDRMDVLGGRFDSALLMEKTFDIDPTDEKEVAKATDVLHREIRNVVASIRAEGKDCLGFADGVCGYCGVCAYPEPCRFPEQLVPSVSSLGVDMGDILGSLGREFSFRKDCVTLYGLVLFKD